MKIIFVSGFGASSDYAKPMCKELQRLTSRIVYNRCLLHGSTLDEECHDLLASCHIDPCETYILIGFSTGCLVAMSLTKYLKTDRVILVNPAEVLTRMTLPFVESLVDKNVLASHKNTATYLPIWQTSSPKNPFWFLFWIGFWHVADFLWWICNTIMGPKMMSRIYYFNIGKKVNEPFATELEKLLFQKPRLNILRKTIVECILKPSLYEKIREYGERVHIISGYNDELYKPYVSILFQQNANVTLHRTVGDHHMIYHYPIETAQRIAACIPSTNVYTI